MNLLPDVSTFKQSLDKIKGDPMLKAAVTKFANADFGSEDVAQVPSKDNLQDTSPNSSLPNFLKAEIESQNNARKFLQLDTFKQIAEQIKNFSSTFHKQSTEMMGILAAADLKNLSKAQQQKLRSAMDIVITGITNQKAVIERVNGEAKKLFAVIIDPDGTLESTILKCDDAIQQLQALIKPWLQIVNHPKQHSQTEVTYATFNIEQVQPQISEWKTLKSTLEYIVTLNQDMDSALSRYFVIWKSLAAKYSAVSEDLYEVGNRDNILAIGNLKAAQDAWTELDQYAKTLS